MSVKLIIFYAKLVFIYNSIHIGLAARWTTMTTTTAAVAEAIRSAKRNLVSLCVKYIRKITKLIAIWSHFIFMLSHSRSHHLCCCCFYLRFVVEFNVKPRHIGISEIGIHVEYIAWPCGLSSSLACSRSLLFSTRLLNISQTEYFFIYICV